MAIFFSPYPSAQPNPALSQYQLSDIWVSQNGGPVQLTYNAVTKKNAWTKYTVTPIVAGLSAAVSGGPPIVSSTLVASKTITAGQTVNYIPVTARGGAATASSYTVTGGTVTGLLATVSPALPAGLTLSTALTVKSIIDAADGITKLYNSVDVTISGTAPNVGVSEQTYTIIFTDAGAQTSSATFKLTVDGGTVSVPLSTTVDIATRTITQGTADSFKPVSGSGGTAPLKYTIVPLLPTGLSIAESTGIVSGTPSVYSGETEYTVTVTDAGGATTTGKFKLTVIAKPVVATLSLATPYTFTQTIPFTAFKPVNGSGGIGSLTYSAVSLPAGLSINPSTGYISGPGTAVTAATTYVITVTDSNTPVASSANASITISVAELAPLNTTLSQTTTYSLTKKSQTYSFTPVTGTGGYGNKTYSAGGAVSLASIGLTLNSSTGLITGNPTALLVATDFTITVSDQAVPPQTSSKTFKIEVLPLALSTTLDVPTPPPGIKNVTITTFRPVSAAGGDGTYTFSISPNITAQTGLTFNASTGYISGTPSLVDAVDRSYTVTVTDQTTPTPQTSSKSFTYRVDSPPILIVNAITEKILTQYDTFSAFTPVTGTGGYGTLTYNVSPTLPAGLVFSNSSGQITGPATRYLVTATTFSVTVSDQALQSNTGSFLLTVNTRPLVVKTDIRSNTFIRGVSITSYKPVSATGGSETYTYELDTSLPTGLSFNTSTGFISGKPTVISTTATYSVTVTDTLNVSGSSTFELGVNLPPTIITTSLVSSSTFYKASTVVNLSPVGLDPLHSGYGSVTFSINPDINADAGLTFGSGGVLSGTVPAAKSNFSDRVYKISATDSLGQTSSTNYTVTVTYVPLSITRVVSDSTFTRSKVINSYIPATSANGSGGTSFTISPDIYANIGLNFDGTVGRIYGTPSSTSAITVYTITAKDSDSNSVSTTTNITVNDPPAITTTATSSSFTLIVNQGVTAFIPVTAAGGDGTISYIIGPTLPSGLTFDGNNGTISGTPVTTSTTATYVVTATDALYQVSSSSFLLNVIPEVVSITVNNPTILLTKYSSQGLPVTPITASGGFGSISYTLSDTLPSGLSFNSSIGEISGTPSSTSTELTYSVVATDSIGQTNSGTFSLIVNDVVIPPLIVTAPESLINLDLGYAASFYPISVSGGFGAYTYAIIPIDLPVGLSFNSIDGSISGTPSAVTTASSYTITVTDAVPQNASVSFQISVQLNLPTSGKGYTGSRGYSGSFGYTGSRSTATGYAGSIGYAGSVGYTGSRSTATGYAGSVGYVGSIGAGYVGSASTETGYAGSVGYVGSIGAGYVGSASTATGYTGSIGYEGSQGEIGDPGETGYTGSQGDIGFPGDPGEPGEVGYTGSASTETGYAGSIGYTGSASTETGYAGSIGYSGSQGYLGSFGYTGSASTATGYTGSASTVTGYTGSQGIQGIQGNAGTSVTITGSTSTFSLLPVPYTGDIGDGYIIADTGHLAVWVGSPTNWEDVGQILGYSGSIGYTGSQGITGYTGSQGLTGYDGSQGYLGSFGYTGSIGYSGSRGEVGYTGSIGYSGSQGESSYTYSDNPPIYPEVGDRWFDSSSGLEFVWTDDGNSTQWVEIAASGFVGNTGYVGSVGNPGSMGPLHLIVALSDETSVIDVGTRIMTFRAPFGMTLTSIPRSSLGTASSSGSVLVDIKVNGTTILGSNKLSIDATEKTSTTAVTPTTLATSTIADDAEITFDITSAGTDAAGLKVTIYYSKT